MPTRPTVTVMAGVVTTAPPEQALSFPPTTTATTTSAPALSSPSTSLAPSAPTTSPAPATVNGDLYTNKWGDVQVQVSFNPDGSIASADAIRSPDRDRKSVRINDQAVPMLNRKVLTAQSSRVDTVSGATYTSRDYQRSLQSAIDAARTAGVTQLT